MCHITKTVFSHHLLIELYVHIDWDHMQAHMNQDDFLFILFWCTLYLHRKYSLTAFSFNVCRLGCNIRQYTTKRTKRTNVWFCCSVRLCVLRLLLSFCCCLFLLLAGLVVVALTYIIHVVVAVVFSVKLPLHLFKPSLFHRNTCMCWYKYVLIRI